MTNLSYSQDREVANFTEGYKGREDYIHFKGSELKGVINFKWLWTNSTNATNPINVTGRATSVIQNSSITFDKIYKAKNGSLNITI